MDGAIPLLLPTCLHAADGDNFKFAFPRCVFSSVLPSSRHVCSPFICSSSLSRSFVLCCSECNVTDFLKILFCPSVIYFLLIS
jgi:hypothetical protein